MAAAHLAGPASDPAAAGSGHVDRVFRALALASLYILFRRWRAGGVGVSEGPSPAEIAAAVALCASVTWLYALPTVGIRRSSRRRRQQD
ncbi:hypothetical protein PR202_gb20743 [Eleusine coracana subsp. coracana]|uniref:Uncharacterized protein n=1 Tax=Eleusine coracana subsp. coracana TaxID=191504 RepID=A0AAV5FB84_ELECO|nr:hypothetical protein QOZ80_7BG0597920 [Eleusine coracana subsp. coracana]GJN32252.1 hypothetical protein PR202_gb20743 [Eleusine coracana subsp. coracana]